MATTKVTYVGRQKPHRERLYGTKTLFSGPGDTQEFDSDIARKMLNNHPDQYASADQVVQVDAESKAENPDNTVDGEIDQVLINGELTPIEKVSRDVLIEIIRNSYKEEISSRTSKPEAVELLTKLIAERGQPEG